MLPWFTLVVVILQSFKQLVSLGMLSKKRKFLNIFNSHNVSSTTAQDRKKIHAYLMFFTFIHLLTKSVYDLVHIYTIRCDIGDMYE
jgi:hypothetical protein